jgi:hypothetical protein
MMETNGVTCQKMTFFIVTAVKTTYKLERLQTEQRPTYSTKLYISLTDGVHIVISNNSHIFVRFEVFTAVTMKNSVVGDVAALVRTYVSQERSASIIRTRNNVSSN